MSLKIYNTHLGMELQSRFKLESTDYKSVILPLNYKSIFMAVHEGIEPSSPDRQSGIITFILMNRIGGFGGI